MTAYALASLLCSGVALVSALLTPSFRRAGFLLCGAFLLIALALFGIDCVVSCVRTGELYVPKR